jgi:hypothetical protein
MYFTEDKVMSSDEKWITEHFEELVAHYGGKYVGIAKRKVIAVGEGADEVAKKAKGIVEPKQLHIVKVPTAQEITCLL